MFAEKVRLNAENDEPKCKNCKRFKPGVWDGLGSCVREALTAYDGMQPVLVPVTDLSLCSAWEAR